ncbi:hypothetical protein BWI97_13930 [Siphonobacter sp. BAB-5405]|uniref:hypothetical protein n=1 Tax=Siphonobacter sp. BAB-5405 TaxID=1864825 RepID=UPI000C80E898|nr:hypothetical protein [Siphonobacter sp. BAB-5405]PMD95695.1 hypothetical protein BWI97_13930 [Siphonobacter sp. BAB-5405]
MKVRCIFNTGKALREFEYSTLGNPSEFGRFGVSEYSEYNEIKVGSTYLVMGLIIFRNYQAYLIDDDGFITLCPCQLFEIIDHNISPNWHFRLIEKNEMIYPFIQSIFGYYELCFDMNSYENIIINRDEVAQQTYFVRKMELEDT